MNSIEKWIRVSGPIKGKRAREIYKELIEFGDEEFMSKFPGFGSFARFLAEECCEGVVIKGRLLDGNNVYDIRLPQTEKEVEINPALMQSKIIDRVMGKDVKDITPEEYADMNRRKLGDRPQIDRDMFRIRDCGGCISEQPILAELPLGMKDQVKTCAGIVEADSKLDLNPDKDKKE